MVPSAMAAVYVLFSEEELANANTSRANRYKKLDGLKLRFLQSVLWQKHESETFTEDWEDIKVKINTRCKGKRRTFLRRLQKQKGFQLVPRIICCIVIFSFLFVLFVRFVSLKTTKTNRFQLVTRILLSFFHFCKPSLAN